MITFCFLGLSLGLGLLCRLGRWLVLLLILLHLILLAFLILFGLGRRPGLFVGGGLDIP